MLLGMSKIRVHLILIDIKKAISNLNSRWPFTIYKKELYLYFL